jgi:hypothetical protein
MYHINMVSLVIDMGYGLKIWEMTVSIRSSSVSIWEILSLCLSGQRARPLIPQAVVLPRPLQHMQVPAPRGECAAPLDALWVQRLTLVYFSAQPEACLTHKNIPDPTHP